jgi:hypothetical protein
MVMGVIMAADEVQSVLRALRKAGIHVVALHNHMIGSAPTSPSSIITDLDATIESVILRCMEKDPRKRPPSALAVSAGLPGGDPLAFAIVAAVAGYAFWISLGGRPLFADESLES